jgi:methylated-DNA-protein-cysteine methyltransferase-like protein
MNEPRELKPVYLRIQEMVRQIPAGRVCSYGQIAQLVGGCTARMVGYAMAALPAETDVPWQRVINARGKISPHGYGLGTLHQRQRLEDEGVVFSPEGVIDLAEYFWP